MKIVAVCIGSPERLPGRRTKTGIFKHATRAGVMVDENGLVGDAVCNGDHHGGLEQAVYGLGTVDLDGWSAELGRPLTPGTLGENLVIDGADSRTVSVGDRFETADVLLEVTSTRTPCATLSIRMEDRLFAKRFLKVARPGFYCRVLKGGVLTAGDAVSHIRFAGAVITMPELLVFQPKRLTAEDRTRYLASPIHAKLRASLVE
ncbi:molybdenum cofactor biosysynthesis protein [Xaviernesmea oryzae]|uniref:Molybdenum cofactor biosysynthesis protein n=1 Tax=Xaviernesmea oryzae TaxID=464029 RepID=A0A1Q9AUT5_9HYPH|nr:MOSC domain-containing protein [Xaviernesmea oryzae]OLP59148.1 molybdenum cofactor biosysynthesis protein [Xaviernesmea oryzae]SEK84383.1 MOSC domain-containing protein YiiM [Xaviernesmea oryzae]